MSSSISDNNNIYHAAAKHNSLVFVIQSSMLALPLIIHSLLFFFTSYFSFTRIALFYYI